MGKPCNSPRPTAESVTFPAMRQRGVPTGRPKASAASLRQSTERADLAVQVNMHLPWAVKDMLIEMRQSRGVAMSRVVEELVRAEYARWRLDVDGE